MLEAIEQLRLEVAKLIVKAEEQERKTEEQDRKLEELEYRLDGIAPYDED